MKKVTFLLIFGIVSTLSFGQTIGRIVDYYGIDFSLTKVIGHRESPQRCKMAFVAINDLILEEYPKYNIARYFEKDSIAPNITVVQKRNYAIDEANIYTNDNYYRISDAQIDSLLKSYQLPQPKFKVGLVIVAELMNKRSQTGTFHVVFFDNATRKVLLTKIISGECGGAGLRNFWARSFLNAEKSWSDYNE